MNSNIEQIIPLAMGSFAGLLVGVIVILVCGLSGVSRTSDGAKLHSGSLLLEGISGLAFNAKRIIPLFLVISLLYVLSTLATAAFGVPLSFADLLTGTGVVFLGHRYLLEKPLQDTGQAMGERGFFAVLVRTLLLALIMIIMAVILAFPYLFIIALFQNAGAPTELPELVLGFALGLGIAAFSLMLSRFSFMFPAAALGRKTWLFTAANESRGAGWALAGALWGNFLLTLVILIPVLAVLGFVQSLSGLPASDSVQAPGLDDPAFLGNFLFLDLPIILITTAYTLVAISIVSAAYRRIVIDPQRDTHPPEPIAATAE